MKLHPDIYAAILDEAQVQDIRVIAQATTLEETTPAGCTLVSVPFIRVFGRRVRASL